MSTAHIRLTLRGEEDLQESVAKEQHSQRAVQVDYENRAVLPPFIMMIYNVFKVIKLTLPGVVLVTLISLLIVEHVVDVVPKEREQMQRDRGDNLSPQISVVEENKYSKTISNKKFILPIDRNLVLVIDREKRHSTTLFNIYCYCILR